MTDIDKKAREKYPENHICDFNCRDGYKTACEEYESLPKIHEWVARDKDGDLNLFNNKPNRTIGPHINCWFDSDGALRIYDKLFPEITWDENPIEVELLIRKITK